MYSSFGGHERKPGGLTLQENTPFWTRKELKQMGYKMDFEERTSGPINAIYFDWQHGSFWGGSSNHGEDYGIGW
jgi:gamma-glutamyltranspeptidase/glutathione hydrolase